MTTNYIKKEVQEVYRVDHKLPVNKIQILKAEGKIDKGLLVKLLEDGSYEVAYWYNKPEIYPIEIEIDGESMKKDAKKVVFKFHPELEKLVKEGGGNGGGGNGGGSFGGGTVAVSSDSGFFTPTYGGGGKRKKRRKRTGIDKLADFMANNSPERKSVQKSEITDFIDWVKKEYKQQDTVFPSGETINHQPARVEYKKGMKKTWGYHENDSLAAGGSKDKEAQKVPELEEDTEDIPFK